MRISLSASAPAGGRSLIRLAIGLSALASTALAHPQPADAPPPPASINPTVLSVTEAGSGCPIGDGGMVSQMRNNTPVFRFMGWGLTLNGSAIPVVLPTSGNSTSPADGQDNHVVRGSVAKFCKETIALGNVPAGFQVHIGEVTVSGMATLDPETTIGIRINTRFDGKEAGRARGTIKATELKADGSFVATLVPDPVTWSPCVGASGRLAAISVRTSVSLNGTALPAGTYSSGTLGGGNAVVDMSKALTLHFAPEWRPCPAESLAPVASPTETASPADPTPPPPASTPPVADPPMKDPPAQDPPMHMGGM